MKFIRLPAIPAHSYLKLQMFPNGAAILVTKEIIANMKNIVMIATVRPFDFGAAAAAFVELMLFVIVVY